MTLNDIGILNTVYHLIHGSLRHWKLHGVADGLPDVSHDCLLIRHRVVRFIGLPTPLGSRRRALEYHSLLLEGVSTPSERATRMNYPVRPFHHL